MNLPRNLLLMTTTMICAWGGAAKPIASYDIKVELEPKTHLLRGSQVLTWLNDSPGQVATLHFHLYMNAFKNEKSTFIRESGGQLRGDRFKKREWGWIDVKRMQVVGGPDVTKAMQFIHPDDDNADDQTVVEVSLPQPVMPGKTIQLAIDFETKMPQVFARTGFHDEYYLVGQWFPKIGVYEKPGFRYATKGGWNCHQFHANSEFFANFGNYRVEITLPTKFVVGATGVERSRTDDPKSGKSTYRFEQEDVTDFAWTASPVFQRVVRTFDAAKQVSQKELEEVSRIHGIPVEDAKLKNVAMILLIQPEHAAQIDRHFKALEAGIKYFGLWYGKYPYDTLTFVDPPYGAGGSGGMEYPTFITCGTPLFPMDDETNPEAVTIHEFGHQFWMQLVATNEFEESPLDEGFNTYSTTKITDLVYGPGRLPVRAFGVNVARWFDMPKALAIATDRTGYLIGPVTDDLIRNSWEYYDSTSYGLNSYMRMGVTLQTLENILGADRMARVMRTYHQTWRYGHPTADDFMRVASQVAGRDLSLFFSQFFRGNRLLDYSVGEVSSHKVRTLAGVFDRDGGKVTVQLADAEKKDKEKQKGESKGGKSLDTYDSVVKLRREGDAVWPVDVLVRFKDGSVERRAWDGQYRWTKFRFEKSSEVEEVLLDPDNKLLLDVNRSNNSHVARPQSPLVAKWSANLLFWSQNLMLWVGAIL